MHLRRAFGFHGTSDFEPLLLLDDFRNVVLEDYAAGFPWHPHCGIEIITYVLAGTVEHGDSMGNRGDISPGDIQWMTAGRGIIHQEMPKGDAAGRMHGLQLWANLPSAQKMTAPRCQEVKAAEIPENTDDDGTHVRLVGCAAHGDGLRMLFAADVAGAFSVVDWADEPGAQPHSVARRDPPNGGQVFYTVPFAKRWANRSPGDGARHKLYGAKALPGHRTTNTCQLPGSPGVI